MKTTPNMPLRRIYTDADPMPFGKFGPKQGDPRTLGDVPAAYWRWLSEQDFLYHHRELAEYIERKLRATDQPTVKPGTSTPPKLKPATPAERQQACATLRDFLKTLET